MPVELAPAGLIGMRLIVDGKPITIEEPKAPHPPKLNLQKANLDSYSARRSLGHRLAMQVRKSRQGERFQYEAMAEDSTPRRCHNCTKPATRRRLTETLRGIDKSSLTFCCEGCE